MRNCLILGSGRSGTSMLAGILHQAGYFMGDKLHQPRHTNPKGFFEWMEINRINEDILAPYGKTPFTSLAKKLLRKNLVKDPGKNQRWLLSLSAGVQVNHCPPSIEERIRRVAAREPFCYKDPRFSYTLPVWQHFLKPDTGFICIFREANVTVASILKECRSQEYLADLYINRRLAYQVWVNIYSHILDRNAGWFERFFFVHYNQVFDGRALPRLSDFLGVALKGTFVDKDLKRTVSHHAAPGNVKRIYQRLCALAGYETAHEK